MSEPTRAEQEWRGSGRRCERCSAEISIAQHRNKFCSDSCRAASKNERRRQRRSAGRVWNCVECGADISRKRADAKYCSDTCANQHEYKANKEAIKAYQRNYVAQNTETVAKAQRRYALRNKAKIADYKRAWAYKNAEHLRAYRRVYLKTWLAKNKHKKQIYAHNRDKRSRENPGSVGIAERDWLRCLQQYRWRCAYCHTGADGLEMEHVIPLSRGGRHAIGNVVPACRPCNQSKGASFVMEWRLRRKTIERLIVDSRQAC